MKIIYEEACKEAGLSEEQTKKIRNVYHSAKRIRERDKKLREKYGISFSHLEPSEDRTEITEDMKYLELEDCDVCLEDIVEKKIMLEKLGAALDELSDEDRRFLLLLYSPEYGTETSLAEQMGVSRRTVQRRKNSLLKLLRKIFEKN